LKHKVDIKKVAVKAIQDELDSISNLLDSIDDSFIDAVEMILNSQGRIIVTGIGKSAIIAQKMVATFNSTGSPSIFLHAADAIHGDLGLVRPDDVIIALSKSGETPEVKVLVPLLKGRQNKLVAIVGNTSSYLAKQADVVLDATVEKEACPNNLAPTSSTTAQLVLGDALAVSLLEMRGFTASDFAKFHPGGALGKRMFMRVGDLAMSNDVPKVDKDESMENAIIEITTRRLGATAVLDNGSLIGIITDGDLRRMIQKHPNYLSLTAKDAMTADPLTIQHDELVVEALSQMRENNITQMPVKKGDEYIGVVHLHDILKEGIF
jgi:arabinose-5-phosphate isomerase